MSGKTRLLVARQRGAATPVDNRDRQLRNKQSANSPEIDEQLYAHSTSRLKSPQKVIIAHGHV